MLTLLEEKISGRKNLDTINSQCLNDSLTFRRIIMYAIVQTGGKQYKVQPGEQVKICLLYTSDAADE